MGEKTKYSNEELAEFEELILGKLEKATIELRTLKGSLNRNNDSGTDSTAAHSKVLEDGADTAEKENLGQLAARQQKFINNLENALIRIKNGTYGVCNETGKLISKERLRAVPHTTLSIEAKSNSEADVDYLKNHIEALIFCSSSPVKVSDIQSCLTEMFDAKVPEEDIVKSIESSIEQYSDDNYSFEIVHSGNGYQYLTKPAYQASIGIMLKQQSKKRLSNSALETLSIIAYKQPTTKGEIEQIRGVNCDYSIQRLLDKGLVDIKGKADTIGRPLIYGTSPFFMEYFCINDISELPTIKDFNLEESSIGEINE